jgi:hypothetical protein
MPRTSLTGDDPGHDLPQEEKDRLERKLREESRLDLRRKKPKDAKKKLSRATNISRRPSRKAQHHG